MGQSMPDEYQYERDDQYCYPGTHILVNKLGIVDETTLSDVERKITYARLVELGVSPVKGNFDLSHLQAIHRYIFQDIYAWAGEVRNCDFLVKGDTIFCRGPFIGSYGQRVFEKLKADDYLRALDQKQFVEKIAFYMGEVNALHPFREGNGRTQREFFRCLAQKARYELDFTGIDKEKHLQADIAAFDLDYEPLQAVLKIAVKKFVADP